MLCSYVSYTINTLGSPYFLEFLANVAQGVWQPLATLPDILAIFTSLYRIIQNALAKVAKEGDLTLANA